MKTTYASGFASIIRAGAFAAIVAFALPMLSAPPIPIEPPSKPGEVWTKQQAEDARKAGATWKPATELWRGNEFSVDLFGSAAVADIADLSDHDAGAGFGLNYFFARNVGLGAEARHTLDKDENFLNQIGLHLIVRVPFGPVAPYAFAGAGYRYQQHDLDLRVYGGAGVEFRLHPNFGVFTDVRYVHDLDHRLPYVGRAGIRLSF